jgi:hypothetical protein
VQLVTEHPKHLQLDLEAAPVVQQDFTHLKRPQCHAKLMEQSALPQGSGVGVPHKELLQHLSTQQQQAVCGGGSGALSRHPADAISVKGWEAWVHPH